MSRTIIAVVTLALALGTVQSARAQTRNEDSVAKFAGAVDLTRLSEVAIHTEGRVKSLGSHARALMQLVSGARKIEGRTPLFMYFDLMLRPQAYADADVIYVKNKTMRADIAHSLSKSLRAEIEQMPAEHKTMMQGRLAALEERLGKFIETGLISPLMLDDTRVHELLRKMSQDVLRGAKPVEALEVAMAVKEPQALRANLRLAPPPGGSFDDRWLTLDDLSDPQAPPGMFDPAKLDPALRGRLIDQWSAFTNAWAQLNAPAVNDAANQLAALLPQVNPELYPDQGRLSWESWYFRMRSMTWVWVFYALAMVPLLLAVVFRWPAARWVGLLMFLGAFGLHTFAVMLRWYVSQRWPNSNMFEAVTTAAWFGGCLAVIFELGVRRLPMRNLLALGSAVASMFALMAVHYFPIDLNANINNKMPVLHDIWLYIHTNVIILSYCLIFIAAVVAGLYLCYRAAGAIAGWSNRTEYAKAGGAGSLIMTRPDGSAYIDEKRSTLGQVLDGTTMVVMELSFILLWTGLVMGAIWADHSWGRPWGWDPKEVFALNTFIIFLLLVHVRLKVKDKGLWTALLAVAGAGVMLFNWIVINFAISGLHSYA